MPSKSPKLRLRNIKLILEYDGSTFFGFQKQPHHPTIQDALEKALSKIFNQKTKITAASGRTDTGVHALGQVVNFKTKSTRKLNEIQNGLNANLPNAIVVREIGEAKLDFHARYSAKSKIYEYLIWNHPIRSPMKGCRAWHFREPLNISRMKRAARILIGRHDFKAFTAAGGSAKETVRNLKHIQIQKRGNIICFQFESDGFLYHMVRNIVGTLVEVGKGRIDLPAFKEILLSNDRKIAGATAPPEGLTLISVNY